MSEKRGTTPSAAVYFICATTLWPSLTFFPIELHGGAVRFDAIQVSHEPGTFFELDHDHDVRRLESFGRNPDYGKGLDRAFSAQQGHFPVGGGTFLAGCLGRDCDGSTMETL